MQFVADSDRPRRTQLHAAAAVRTPIGRRFDGHPLRMVLLTAAIAEYEAHEPPHRQHPVAYCRQRSGIDRPHAFGSEFRRHDTPERLGFDAIRIVGPAGRNGITRRGVGVLADESPRRHGHKSSCRHEIRQFACGLFVGAVSVEHDHHGRRSVAPHRVEPLQGERGHMPAIDGNGEDRHIPTPRSNVGRTVRHIANNRLRTQSPSDGLGHTARTPRRREITEITLCKFHSTTSFLSINTTVTAIGPCARSPAPARYYNRSTCTA